MTRINGDLGNLNNAQIFGKKVDADAQKKLAAKTRQQQNA